MPRSVRFEVPCDVAYDYLVDPANRPEWQSSLRSVSGVVGENDVPGQRWHDHTVVGMRPLMELTDADRPHRWSERGTWRGVHATLTLTFEPVGDACDVTPTMALRGPGPLGAPVALLGRLAPLAVRGDLRRAAAVLARRGPDM